MAIVAVGTGRWEAVATHGDIPDGRVYQATDAPAEEDGRIRDRGDMRLDSVDDVVEADAVAAAESGDVWTSRRHARGRGRGRDLLRRRC